MIRLLSGLLVAAMLSLPATAAKRNEAPPQKSLEQRVELLERKFRALSDMLIRLDGLQREIQQLRGEVEVQNHAMDALKRRQRDLYLDVDQRLSQLSGGTSTATPPGAMAPAAPGTPGPAVEGRPQPPVVSPPPVAAPTPPQHQVASAAPSPPPGGGDPAREEQAYQQAFDLLMQRRYDESRSAFQNFLSLYPTGSYSDNAQYWLAEASYVTRDFDRALVEFQKVIQEHPSSPKVPDALLKSSFIQYEKKQWQEARATLEDLIKRYPSTTASRLAKQRLERMRSEGR